MHNRIKTKKKKTPNSDLVDPVIPDPGVESRPRTSCIPHVGSMSRTHPRHGACVPAASRCIPGTGSRFPLHLDPTASRRNAAGTGGHKGAKAWGAAGAAATAACLPTQGTGDARREMRFRVCDPSR